jgi:peptidoglycan/xylan/chitin deacetylase (PgdA/CDA1 family)
VIENPPPWPGGATSAAAITFDVDAESPLHYALGAKASRHLSALSWFGYDRVAVPRILSAWRRRSLRQTFFVPAWCMERYAPLVEEMLADGHDVGLHGDMHETPYELGDPDDERRCVERGIETMDRLFGVVPAGYRAPLYGLTPETVRLLAEAGLRYDSSLMGDDVPYVLETPAGELTELPVDWANDDWPQYVQSFEFAYHMTTRAPARALEVFAAELSAARRHGGLWIAVWHPFVSGRLARFDAVLALVDELLADESVWLTTLADVERHVGELRASGAWSPHRERVDPAP